MNQNSEHPGVLSPLKQALLSLETMQSKLEDIERLKTEPLAIIGMGCRFPGGANNPEQFWQLLRNGVDAVSEMPKDRWDVKAYHDPNPDAPGKIYTRHGSFLNDIDKFDAEFFNISPREARSLDPQQRLLLEVAWEALENAGQAPDRLAGSQTGVFMGIMTDDYSKLHVKAEDSSNIDAYFVTGVNFSFAAGRLSYVLGLHGPSLSIDTACSSSLVAVHLACRSLRFRECDVALAGGVSLILSPELYITLSRFRALSADGRCKTFDAAADGFGRGEGCGVVVLKRLSDALANGDNILALIRGSAVNHDGPSGGLTVPNGLAQQAMIRQALTDARVRPAEVSYVEAHGTGTSLGDPIEVRALGAVLGEGRAVDNRLMIGSAKSNIGHLDSAAGVAGLIKLVLSMQNEEIPPLLHFKQINPHISLNQTPVTIPTKRTPWPAGNERRIAGVSSFGLSGTNAHALVEEAPAAQPATLQVDRPLHLLSVSAKSPLALKELAGRFEMHLTTQPLVSPADICFTANTGRSHFSHRLAVVAESSVQMREKLGNFANGQKQPGVMSGQIEGTEQPKVAFLFTGQGSQYVGMGRQLYETQPTFRAVLDKCNELLRPHLEQPLLSVIYPESGSSPLLDETAYTQPALFAIEYALAELWRSWGIEPAIVLGHSVGEYVAACVAGIFSLENGLKLIAERGRLMQALPRDGMMAVVFAEEERVEAAIAPYFQSVSIAAYNGPKNIVISGERSAVQTVIEKLRNEKVKTQPLNVSHAFHSPLMEPMLDAFEQTAHQVNFNASRLPLVSNLTGQILSFDEIPDAAYWRHHIRQGVRFSATMQTLQREGYTFFLEIGPSPTLLGMGKLCIPDAHQAQVWLPSLRKNIADWQQMLESLGTLYVHGLDVDHAGFERDYKRGRRRVALPTYPFQRERYWLETGGKHAEPRSIGPSQRDAEQTALHPLLGRRLRSALKEIQYEAHLRADSPSFLMDHRVYGTVVVPGTAYVEMALAAASEAFGPGNHLLEEVTIHQALILPDASPDATVVQLILTPEGAEKAAFQVVSLIEKDNWKVHVTGNIRLRQTDREPKLEGASLSAAQARCQEKIDATTFYAHLHELGLQYGPYFRGISQIWKHNGEVLGQIGLPQAAVKDLDDYRIHPALLDSTFQLLLAVPFETGEMGTDVYLPVGMKRIAVYERSSNLLWSQIIVKPNDAESDGGFAVDVRLFNETGKVVAEVEDLYVRRASREALQRAIQSDVDAWLYEVIWEIQELDPKLKIGSSREKAGEWLIFADQSGVGTSLAERLQAQGESCVLVFPAETFRVAPGGPWLVNPSRPADFQQLLQEVVKTGRPLRGVVYLWALDSESGKEKAQTQICGGALHLVQALAASGEGLLGLWLVTRGAQPAGPEPTPLAAAQATLWGLGSTIATEHAGLHCVRVDLDPWPETDQSEVLFWEAWSGAGETQVAFRGANRWVARMVRHHGREDEAEHCLVLPKDRAFQLDVSSRGLLDTLVFRPTTLQQPGPGEVEIRVRATGLNFKDVLKALGRYPGTDSLLGDECSGTITAVGKGVERLHVGDEVVGVAYGSFRSSVVTRADLVVPKPHNLSFAQAVTMPIAFLTAYYTLHHLAKISAGKRVLIHAAAGGVGMAAVRLAQQAGAEIFATAGSSRKRALLRSIGVPHVLDSRTLDFADQIMNLTEGRGVDIVLNSLAGEFIPKSLSVLAPKGCFLEIGKTGIWDQSQVTRFKPDADYFVFYLGDIVDAEPGLIQKMLGELMASIQSGALEPLPYRIFPIQEAIGAFRYMAQAKHIGKIVLTQEEETRRSAHETFSANATYLITGGLGGLGLKSAEWMVTQGARSLVLVGRSGTTGDAGETVRRLEETGARVVVARADVSQQDQIAKVIAEIDEAMPPLRGIIHAAGVLDDGVLLQQKWERFTRVMAPKVDGAWNLHLLTKNKGLDFFVLFSSTAPILGAPGQGNYASANAFLDALAHLRQAQGLPGLSINWGPWSEVGMVAVAHDQDQRRLSDQGMDFISPAQGMQILSKLLHQAAPQMVVLPIDWAKFCKFFPAALEMRLITHLTRGVENPVGEETEYSLTRESLLAATPPERQQLLEIYLRDQVAKVLQLPAGSVDALQPLNKLGFDSLMALELLNRIETDLKITIPMAQFLQGRTVAQLTGLSLEKLSGGVESKSENVEFSDAKTILFDEKSSVNVGNRLSRKIRTLFWQSIDKP